MHARVRVVDEEAPYLGEDDEGRQVVVHVVVADFRDDKKLKALDLYTCLCVDGEKSTRMQPWTSVAR